MEKIKFGLFFLFFGLLLGASISTLVYGEAIMNNNHRLITFEKEHTYAKTLGYNIPDLIEFTHTPISNKGIADKTINGIFIGETKTILVRNDTDYLEAKVVIAHEVFHSMSDTINCRENNPLGEELAHAYSYYRYPIQYIQTYRNSSQIVKQISLQRVNCLDTFFRNYSAFCQNQTQTRIELFNACGVVI